MNKDKIPQLMNGAKIIMANSSDPIHDLEHVERVVNNVEVLIKDIKLTQKEKDAVILAAWWHDVGRTLTKNPHTIWMTFFDDMISSAMLWKQTLKIKMFGSTAGMASRLILCKSIGTGKVFTKIFLRKKTRILLDILQDADELEMLDTNRLKKMLKMIKNSKMPLAAYKFLSWYTVRLKSIKLKTKKAKQLFEKIIKQLIEWLREPEIIRWHMEKFGIKWLEKMERKIETLLDHITLQNLKLN